MANARLVFEHHVKDRNPSALTALTIYEGKYIMSNMSYCLRSYGEASLLDCRLDERI